MILLSKDFPCSKVARILTKFESGPIYLSTSTLIVSGIILKYCVPIYFSVPLILFSYHSKIYFPSSSESAIIASSETPDLLMK